MHPTVAVHAYPSKLVGLGETQTFFTERHFPSFFKNPKSHRVQRVVESAAKIYPALHPTVSVQASPSKLVRFGEIQTSFAGIHFPLFSRKPKSQRLHRFDDSEDLR